MGTKTLPWTIGAKNLGSKSVEGLKETESKDENQIIIIIIIIIIKVGYHSRWWPEGSLFNTVVSERALLYSLDCSTLPLYSYLIIQGGIKYHFLSLWYDSTWDWALVSWAIGEHFAHWPNDGENYTNSDWCFWYTHQRIIKGTWKTWK